MLYRSLSVAIIVLLSWFTYASMQSNQQIRQQLNSLQSQFGKNVEPLVEKQIAMNEQMEQIQSFITKQNQIATAKKKVDASLAKQTRLTALYETYSKVLMADALRSSKKYAEAAKLLKSTKKEIWKAGDLYKEHQKPLRGLMQTVDALVKAWNAKDGSKNAAKVYTALNNVLQDKGK